MSRAKVFISILTVLILIALSGVSVWAAPAGQEGEPTVISVVDKIKIDEETEPTTVLVTLVFVDETTNDPTGETQTVRVSVDTAKDLGLLQVDDSGELVLDDGKPIADETKYGTTVEIDSTQVIEYVEEDGEEVLHPVVLALTEFFAKLFADTLELDYDETMDEIMGYHEDGMGFGVIAQACWMSFIINDPDDSDAPKITPRDILEAKKNHTLGSIDPELLGVEETPTNWGQFKKAVLKSGKVQKNLANLGAIMSGRGAGEQEQEEEEEEDDDVVGSSTELSGKGKDKGGKPDAPPGKVKNKDKDKGGGPPAVPPGQEKDKDKDKGGGKGKGK